MRFTRSQLAESFRMQFQQDLKEYMARHGSAADGFAVVWENTLNEWALEKEDQAPIYWELVNWVRSYDRFTSTPDTPAAQSEH